MTESGKSLWAKALSLSTSKRGIEAIIFDPRADRGGRNVEGWTGHVYTDFARFSGVFWASSGCLAIIDEAFDVYSEADTKKDAIKMLTRGRHRGHCVVLLAQRWKLLNKTARDQCSRLVCFTVNREDAAELSLDFNCDCLADAHRQPKLHFVSLELHGQPVRGIVPLPGRRHFRG